jgi:hypothetical protein
MAAGFQVHVERIRRQNPVFEPLQERTFGMRFAKAFMKSLRDDLARTDEHSSHERVCAYLAAALRGEGEATVDELLVHGSSMA